MTHDQRNAAIKQMLKHHAETVSVSKQAARDFLIKSGLYTKEGTVSAKYRGTSKRKSA
jgi:hypothetical protein